MSITTILYFLLFGPEAPALADPREAQPLSFHAPGIGAMFARTGWDSEAAWFTYRLDWNSIDHQLYHAGRGLPHH